MRTTQAFAFIISYNWGSGRNGKKKKKNTTPPHTHIKLFTSADNNNEMIISCSI